MAISPVASSGATSNAQSLAIIAQAKAKAKATNQQALVDAQNQSQDKDPISQAPTSKASINSNGQAIGTTINVTA